MGVAWGMSCAGDDVCHIECAGPTRCNAMCGTARCNAMCGASPAPTGPRVVGVGLAPRAARTVRGGRSARACGMGVAWGMSCAGHVVCHIACAGQSPHPRGPRVVTPCAGQAPHIRGPCVVGVGLAPRACFRHANGAKPDPHGQPPQGRCGMASPRLTGGRRSNLHSLYAITTVTRDRAPLFSKLDLAHCIAAQIAVSDEEGSTSTHAWVVMPDHVHWLFSLERRDLSACVARFKSRSARAIHQARGSRGRVWQSGYFDHRVRNEDDFRTQARYILDNPLRAGLVKKLADYPHWGCRWICR
jgi:putative transposase